MPFYTVVQWSSVVQNVFSYWATENLEIAGVPLGCGPVAQ